MEEAIMSSITETPRGERIASILMLLIRNRRRKYSVADIYDYLNQSEQVILRNVQRDCKALADRHGDVIGVERCNGKLLYFIQPDMRRSLSLPIQHNSLLAFFLLKRLQSFFPQKANALRELEEAVIDRSSESAYDLFEDLDENLDEKTYRFGDQSTIGIDDSMFSDMLTALVNKRKLKILYSGGIYEKPKEKVICPVKLILFKNELYFLCISEYKQTWDFFIKLCRVHKAQITGDTFVPDPARVKRIEKRLVESFGILDESQPKPQKVVVRFPGDAYYQNIFAEKRYHATQKVSVDKKKNVLVTMTVPVGLDLVNWVLSWPEAVVLEPESLKKELQTVAKKLTAKYGK